MFHVRLSQIAAAVTDGLQLITDELQGLKTELRKRKITHRAETAAHEGGDSGGDEDVRSEVA
jgi:hypothetical protein